MCVFLIYFRQIDVLSYSGLEINVPDVMFSYIEGEEMKDSFPVRLLPLSYLLCLISLLSAADVTYI